MDQKREAAVSQREIGILLLRKVGTGQATKQLMTIGVGLSLVKDQSLSSVGGNSQLRNSLSGDNLIMYVIKPAKIFIHLYLVFLFSKLYSTEMIEYVSKSMHIKISKVSLDFFLSNYVDAQLNKRWVW